MRIGTAWSFGDGVLGVIEAVVDLNCQKSLGKRSGNIFGSEDFEVKKINVWGKKVRCFSS